MTRLTAPTRNDSTLKPTGNGCLRALSSGALALLRPHLTEVTVDDGFVFWDGDFYPNTLFPVSGLVSITVRFASGESIEVAAIGHEGAAAIFVWSFLFAIATNTAIGTLGAPVHWSEIRVGASAFRGFL